MPETLIKVGNASKKFCKSLKRLMLYGLQDVAMGAFGDNPASGVLRKNEFWAVDDVSFEVKKGETLGLVGPNGSGKTTLLKMLNGIFMPDKGKISIKGRVGVLIHVGAGFHPMLTGRENIYVNGAILGMRKKEIDRKFGAIVDFAEIGDFLDVPVRNYSSGMYVRLGFSVAVHCEPDILLVDEVLAVGDAGFQNKCMNEIGKLRKNGVTTVIVSHDMHLISIYADKVLLLNHGKGKNYDDVSEAMEAYTSLFIEQADSKVHKICSGNDNISFLDERINSAVLTAGDDFSIHIKCDSSRDYDDALIDIWMHSSSDPGLYFEATNEAYDKRIDIKKGLHDLEISVKDLRISNASATIGFAVWAKNKYELLLWWEMPLRFTSVAHSAGKNFLKVSYDVK